MKTKPLGDFPDYSITRTGRVWSKKSKKWLINITAKTGYFVVSLYKNDVMYQRFIHRLVLETFIGPCPVGMEACHYNGIRTSNRLSNLRWDTRSNNRKDAIRHGTHCPPRGEHHHKATLKESDVKEIRQLLHQQVKQKEIAKLFCVVPSTISAIRHNRNRWTIV